MRRVLRTLTPAPARPRQHAPSPAHPQVWRVDVGMSSGVLDAPAGILEISPAVGQGESVCRIVTDDIRGLSDDESDMDIIEWPQSV